MGGDWKGELPAKYTAIEQLFPQISIKEAPKS
jgi:hypothetical protein